MPRQEKQQELTAKQVAELLGVTKRAVQFMIKRGVFPNAYQLPGGTRTAFLIPASDLDAYLAAREQDKKKRRQST